MSDAFPPNNTNEARGRLDALPPKTVLQNQYQIMGLINEGGMSRVYKGRDLSFTEVTRLVAIKEMRLANREMTAAMVDFFRQEANLLATLNHPTIPKIYNFFEQHSRVYLVMEFINGVDLESIMEKARQLPLDKVVEWAAELCDVLEYLHNQKPAPIIFRDMKPANVMIDSHGRVKLIDFGIAKSLQLEHAGNGDPEQSFIGTPGYAPPELYRREVLPVSDIFSLGATLHHVLTRTDPQQEPPFTFSQRPISEYNPQVPETLVAIIDKALQKNTADRWQSAGEMRNALQHFRYGQPQAVESASAPVQAPRREVTPLWTLKTDGEIRGTPTSFRGIVYVGPMDSKLLAIDCETGQEVWNYTIAGQIGGSPAVEEDALLVMFGTEEGYFHALDYHTGREEWWYSSKEMDRIRCTPSIFERHVFFGSDNGNLYALVTANGHLRWNFGMGSEVRSQPCVTNEMVVAGTENGDVLAVLLSGAGTRWNLRTKGRILGSPMVDPTADLCYVGSFDRLLYAVESDTGFEAWRFRTENPIVSTPAYDDTFVFVTSTDGNLYAVNKRNGKERWRFSTEKAIVSSPTVHKGVVYFGGNDGCVYCLDALTGEEQWVFETGGPITGSPHVAENKLIIGSLDKTLYALPLA